ncbi:MAG: RnfABCDGE type electron transport complex subunit D [Acutalibacteraceae bacterium]
MEKLYVSSSPHLHSSLSTRKIMLNVIVALLPAAAAGIILFGLRSALVTAVCVASCVFFEWVFEKITKKPSTVGDLSAVVTGILLAFNLPVSIPLWMAVIGSAAAIIVVKQFFGGIGQNFANPAIVGRIVLLLSFSSAMTNWTPTRFMPDAVTSATPLAVLSGGGNVSTLDLFLGNTAGCLGETCALALLIGGIYLCLTKTVSPIIPLCFIGTVFVFAFFNGGCDFTYALNQILSGGLMLGAFFMATDYTTSPINKKGKVIFAVGCGILTSVIRFWANLPEGVSYSILLMNILVPLIERFTTPKPFGWESEKK